jgi:hypothetical protein
MVRGHRIALTCEEHQSRTYGTNFFS